MSDIADEIYATTGLTLNAEAAAAIGQMIQQARRDALAEAARRVEMMWVMFRERDDGASDWIFRAHDDIPTGDDFVAAIRALGERQ